MKTGEQIEVFFFKTTADAQTLFLLMKRVPDRGGFWQPLTGGVEEGESLEQTVRREAAEETGIKQLVSVIDTGFNYAFEDHGRQHVEFVYGAEVNPDTEITLSSEHCEYRWTNKEEAVSLLKWPGNIEGLKWLCQKLDL